MALVRRRAVVVLAHAAAVAWAFTGCNALLGIEVLPQEPDVSDAPEADAPDVSDAPEADAPDAFDAPEADAPDVSDAPEADAPDVSDAPEADAPDGSPTGTIGRSCDGGLVCNAVSCCESRVVPGGSFAMGRSGAGTDACPSWASACEVSELPEHDVGVSTFYLDTFEVTVGRFRRFVDAYPGSKPAAGAGAHPAIPSSGWHSSWDANLPTGRSALVAALKCNPQNHVAWTDAAEGKENRAVNCVDWHTAFAFCAWDGGRLPTEAEWEYAAAGGAENRLMPWGPERPDATRVDITSQAANARFDVPVGAFAAGAGRWGHLDLAGHAWEWTRDLFDANWYGGSGYDCTDCANVAVGTMKATRGGSCYGLTTELRAARRNPSNEANRYDNLGFRCARDR